MPRVIMAKTKLRAPGAFVINNTNEWLQRPLLASGSTTTVCLSIWMKTNNSSSTPGTFLQSSVSADSFPEAEMFFSLNREMVLHGLETGPGDFRHRGITGNGIVLHDNSWVHYLYVYNSAHGTDASRIRFYRNNSQISDTQTNAVSLNEQTVALASGNTLYVGNAPSRPFAGRKVAFIDVVDGTDCVPSDFAFDNGGTWTRKPFAGSHGAQGFSLTGQRNFHDVSGNGHRFVGNNMTLDNIDRADLPPYTV